MKIEDKIKDINPEDINLINTDYCPDHEYSERFMTSFDSLVQKEKTNNRKNINKFRISTIAAAILIFVCVGFFVYKNVLLNNISNANQIHTITKINSPNWIPDNFHIDKTIQEKNSYKIIYSNDISEQIQFEQSIHTQNDTENYDESIYINGNLGFIFSDKNTNTIIWNDGQYQYSISSNLSLPVLIKMAESIK